MSGGQKSYYSSGSSRGHRGSRHSSVSFPRIHIGPPGESQGNVRLASYADPMKAPGARIAIDSGLLSGLVGGPLLKALPVARSLSNAAAREFYLQGVAKIAGALDRTLPIRELALKALSLRNELKLLTRELMADRAAAGLLPPPAGLRDLVLKAYRGGLRGDDVYRYIIEGAGRASSAVNKALGLEP